MKKMNLILIILFASVIGFTTGIVLNDKAGSFAAADDDIGIQVNQEQAFKECFAVSLWMVAGRKLSEDYAPQKTVIIPTGWTPIGGSGRGQGNEGAMILCR